MICGKLSAAVPEKGRLDWRQPVSCLTVWGLRVKGALFPPLLTKEQLWAIFAVIWFALMGTGLLCPSGKDLGVEVSEV